MQMGKGEQRIVIIHPRPLSLSKGGAGFDRLNRRGVNGYPTAFAVLLIPALLALATLAVARWRYPHPRDLETNTAALAGKGLDRRFWWYLVAVGLIALGYADFPLIAYHFEKANVVASSSIPLFYATAMGVDALAALVFGRLFDRLGFSVLAIGAALAALFAPLVFLGGSGLALLGVGLWGIGMGAQESVMRAGVAEMVAADRRGTAYGLFWFLGSALMGVLYDTSIVALVLFAVIVQLLAIPLFLWVKGA